MEKATDFFCAPDGLYLETDAGSALVVLPGGIIITAGFEDSPTRVLEHFSQRLHLRAGILCLELKDHCRGVLQQIPLAEADDSPKFREWLAETDRIIP